MIHDMLGLLKKFSKKEPLAILFKAFLNLLPLIVLIPIKVGLRHIMFLYRLDCIKNV